jgi:molybdopterin converting factor small subunit
MSLTIRIPTQLRTFTGGSGEVEVEAASVGDALKALDAAHPGLADRLFDDSGQLRRFVMRMCASWAVLTPPLQKGRRSPSSPPSPEGSPSEQGGSGSPCARRRGVVSY